MFQLVPLLTNITKVLNIMNLISNIVSKFRKPKEQILTTTDKITDAIEVCDQITAKMEKVGYILQSIPDHKKKESLKDVFLEHGVDEATWKQMFAWNKDARFCWASFGDELKILLSERMSEEQRRDRIKHAPKKKKKKLRLRRK